MKVLASDLNTKCSSRKVSRGLELVWKVHQIGGCSVMECDICAIICVVRTSLLASGKDRVSQYVIVIMDYCPGWTLLSDTRSDHEVTRYMYSLYISHHGLSLHRDDDK